MGRIEKLVILLLGVFIFIIITLFINGYLVKEIRDISVIFGSLATVVFLLISYYYIILYNKTINGIQRSKFITFKLSDLYLFFFGAVICILSAAFQVFLIHKITPEIIIEFAFIKLPDAFINNVLVGILEELFFRAFIFISLLKILGKFWVALSITSLAFAIVHINNFEEEFFMISFANVFIAGCILACLYYYTNSIWSSIGFHSFNNIMNAVIIIPDNLDNYILNTILYLIILLSLIVVANRTIVGKKLKRLSM